MTLLFLSPKITSNSQLPRMGLGLVQGQVPWGWGLSGGALGLGLVQGQVPWGWSWSRGRVPWGWGYSGGAKVGTDGELDSGGTFGLSTQRGLLQDCSPGVIRFPLWQHRLPERGPERWKRGEAAGQAFS